MSYIQNGGGGGAAVVINGQIGSYQLALSDAGGLVEMNVASPNTLTVPDNATVPFPLGTVIKLVQVGTGATTVVAAGGVTGDNFGTLSAQWSTATLYKRGTDEWVLAVGL